MKIRRKRIIAVIIDHFIVCFVLLFLDDISKATIIPSIPSSLDIVLVVLMLSLKDFTFRNASVGKMIMGLRIVDEKGKRPAFNVLIKRGFLMPTLGFIKFYKAFFFTEYTDFIDWERDFFHTQVVLKKDLV